MLTISVPEMEFYNDSTSEFITLEARELRFEHSLVSLTRWEEIYRKPFLSSEKTPEEVIHYFKLMCLDKVENYMLTDDVMEQLGEYLSDTPTATTLSDTKKTGNKMILTSEVIYAYMANAQLPFTCETWNLNKLMTLLGVIGELNNQGSKKSNSEILTENERINEMRKAKIEKLRKEMEARGEI